MNKYLKEQLEIKKISQNELARRIGITKGYMSQIINDKEITNLSLNTIYNIALALDIPIEIFVKRILDENDYEDIGTSKVKIKRLERYIDAVNYSVYDYEKSIHLKIQELIDAVNILYQEKEKE